MTLWSRAPQVPAFPLTGLCKSRLKYSFMPLKFQSFTLMAASVILTNIIPNFGLPQQGPELKD